MRLTDGRTNGQNSHC